MLTRRRFLHWSAATAGAIPLAKWAKLYASAFSETEQQIRERLGIPASAEYVLIMDQAAHMDWDWNFTFPEYFVGDWSSNPGDQPEGGNGVAVNTILADAVGLLGRDSAPGAKQPYFYYSLCEMGFFKKFVDTQMANGVDVVAQIRAAGNYLRIVGGGITSPDCLVCSGEGFLRNYLVGKLWLASVFPELLPLKHCWIPDDFGQDPELPVAVQALGMTSIGFSRLPGITPGNPSSGISDTTLAEEMLSGSVDFWWSASDNASTVFAHWMPGGTTAGQGYYQGGPGNGTTGLTGNVVSAIQNFLAYYNKDFTTFTPPFSGAPTHYLYMPIDQDFMDPLPQLAAYVNQWNTSGQTGGVYAVEASYDDFASLVLASGSKLTSQPYNGTNYWMGYYASRPDLKILHYGTTRLLLAAEVFGLLAFGENTSAQAGYWGQVSQAWTNFAPSTHHDYITGTAADDVFQTEQIPNLQNAYDAAQSATVTALNGLAASAAGGAGEVLIANPAGVAFEGPVELPASAPADGNSIVIGHTTSPLQATFEGGLVFRARVPSLGYTTGRLSPRVVHRSSTVTVSPEGSGATAYTLQNEHMTVVVSASSNWGISSLTDALGNSLLQAGQTGNDLVFYTDSGNIFQFANEIPDAYNPFAVAALTVETTGSGLGASVLETGPVRARLKTVVSITIEGSSLPSQIFIREYCLVAGEPFLRMTTTGAAPDVSTLFGIGYSIMTAFPLAQPVSSTVHGTPCHWTSAQPHTFYPPPIFQATHHFLLPQANNGTVLAAIYHPEVPAWGYDQSGVLLGCLLRNTPGTQRGANGTDTYTNTLRYAFRVPNGLGAPQTGHPLHEALNYTAPAVAQLASQAAGSYSRMPASGFLASVSSPGVIQTAKPGDVVPGTLILRLYQPSNSPQTLTVTLGAGRPAMVKAVTALEDPITSGAPAIQITEKGFKISVTSALNTVQISF
ncbi:MAG: hypothetical protein ABSF46_07270 [Terriglobia bacterium]